ncbi:unnamed protein product [Prorocentrum cordatum]|uniref:Pentacotripeptide-repeat region of PRORP domain-containing protein n=1 Tax=Prorocentrum cordatum TaxID=2364126 RepID=A0ABN9UT16_9DINO|nr:unnamed protein product [Polarella glacialis]
MLTEMREAKLEPDRWDQRVREGRAVATGVGAAKRDAGGEAGAHRHQLQRWDQRVREGRAVAAGAGAVDRNAGGEAGARLSYNAGTSACEKGQQWQRALALLSEMKEVKLERNVISYCAGISACEKGEQWQRALALLSEMREAKLEPDVISYSAGISACEKATALGSTRARRVGSGNRR